MTPEPSGVTLENPGQENKRQGGGEERGGQLSRACHEGGVGYVRNQGDPV